MIWPAALPVLTLALVLVAGGAAAQAATETQAPITLSFTIGRPGSGDLQVQPVMAGRLDEEGVVSESAVLQRKVAVTGGVQGNAALAVALGPSWSARFGAGLGRARVTQTLSGAREFVEEATEATAGARRDVNLSTLEAALRYRLPSAHVLRPYLEVGVGMERWSAEGDGPLDPAGVGPSGETVTRYGSHAAVGGDYPVAAGLNVRVQASVRMHRTPLAPLPDGTEVARGDTLVLTAGAPPAAPFADTAIELVTRLRFEIGLSYALGGGAAARPGRSGSNGT
jgi:hypothetical protein